MITGIFHKGSGLGNQLFRYVFTRTKAQELGVDFGIENPENFKGSFIHLDMGKPPEGITTLYFEEKVLNPQGHDIRPYDTKSRLIRDNTEVDGEFQDPKYFNIDEVREWLKVSPREMPDNLCVIGFRGGEYVGVKDLFLPKSYWIKAIRKMLEKYPDMEFEVHTDDVSTAKEFFPDFPCIHDIELNWRSVRYAKHLIIANSSFYILPALLGDAQEIIAPLYWAGHNKGFWQLPQNQYDKFTYI